MTRNERRVRKAMKRDFHRNLQINRNPAPWWFVIILALTATFAGTFMGWIISLGFTVR